MCPGAGRLWPHRGLCEETCVSVLAQWPLTCLCPGQPPSRGSFQLSSVRRDETTAAAGSHCGLGTFYRITGIK